MSSLIHRSVITCLSAVLVLSAGCETTSPRTGVSEHVGKIMEEAIATNPDKAAVPEEVADALLPTIDLSSAKLPKVESQDRFDISVSEVPADQFFLSLVDGTPYNIVIHPEVRGSITLNLQNVGIPDVLEAVRDVYGYEFVSTPYGFQVLPGRLQARIYQINYLNVERAGKSATLVSSGALTSTESNNSGDRQDRTRSGGDQTSSTRLFGTEISTRQPVTTFWSELRDSIAAIVGEGEGRDVVVNPQSGVVVVRALPTELREVETFLRATQLIVQRQVILEAKIIEVRLDDLHQTGINWAGILKPGSDSITVGQIGGGSVLVDEGGVSGIAGNTGNLDPDNLAPILGTASEAFGGVFTLALNLGDFTAFIELLKTQGNVQILSSPRVSTMNNQKAVIKVGTDEFFVTEIETQNVSSATATTVVPDITLTPFFSGIALDVTPQISESGDVTLHVHPSISEVVDQQKTVIIGNLQQQLPLALSTVRETDSIVRAKSGQVVVIGGLMQDIIDDQDAKTPVAGDIPLLGNLFKHKRHNTVKSELVILLRPVVVAENAQWRSELEKSADYIKRVHEPPK
ncbi:MAG: pilus (MSHA type) biogenesis protein MshL [Gammaproteobacteria bacterium]|nr:pilus (MSHA type) biogenesis protein MshL [Gammaproteobacteria bacterium]